MIGSIIDIIGNVLDRVLPDTVSKEKAKAKLQELETKGEIDLLLKQIEVNQQEAKHSSVFVAGWRPAVGWSCVAIFVWHYLLLPILITIATLHGTDISNLPQFDLSDILYVMGALLGIGGFRTFEKIKNVSRETMK